MMKLQTERGYPFDEAASALQKSIRRGLEVDALYWAIELEGRYADYLWKRLQVISVEDIGIADMQVVLYVAEMRRIYQELRREYDKAGGKKARSFRMALGSAVLALCRARKSRINDEFQIVVYGRREDGWKAGVPDYALDMHTSRGRGMKRGPSHFWTEGVKLANGVDVGNPYHDEAVQLRTRQRELQLEM
jgi:replication-associated recombination protein RarA